MKCKISVIKGNLRYRILTINNKNYILDMGKSFWSYLLPALSWVIPHTVYEVNDEKILKKIETSSNPEEKTKQKNVGELVLLIGAMGMPLGSVLYSLLDKSLFSNSFYINIIVVSIPYLFIVSLFIYLNIKFKKNLTRIIPFNDFSTVKVWIRPQSLKHKFATTFSFLFFLIPSLLLFLSYIQEPNTLPLILGICAFIFAVLNSFISIPPGDFTAKFKKEE